MHLKSRKIRFFLDYVDQGPFCQAESLVVSGIVHNCHCQADVCTCIYSMDLRVDKHIIVVVVKLLSEWMQTIYLRK